jgi:hypothetical protein
MKIKFAQKEDRGLVSNLRKEAYQVATNTQLVDSAFLNWNQWDDRSLIFIMENATGEAVSSMRALLVHQPKDIETVFDISLDFDIALPALIMDRSTTLVSYRRRGFSAIFRFLMIKSCIDSPVQNITATVNEGVSRIPHLQTLGYVFRLADISQREQEVFVNASNVLIGVLHHSRFSEAAVIAERNLRTPLSYCQMEDSLLPDIHAYLNA